MIEIEEQEDGLFTVSLTAKSYEYLDKVSKACDIPCETILAFWIMTGQQSFTKLIEP